MDDDPGYLRPLVLIFAIFAIGLGLGMLSRLMLLWGA